MSEPETPDIDLPLAETGIAPRASPRAAAQAMLRGHWLFVPVLLVTFLAGGIVGLYFQPPGLQAVFRTAGWLPGAGTDTPIAVAVQQVADGEELAVVSEGDVVALGRVLPRGDVVTVAPPFGAGDARIATMEVRPGDAVVPGQIIATLDSLPQLLAQLETARANVAVAEATVTQTQASTLAARDEAEANLQRAIATEQAASEELSRATALLARGVTTRAVLDTAIARATEAARDVERNRATLSRYQADTDGAQADVAVARANLAAAMSQRDQAELDIEKAYVRAPSAGTILDIHVQQGERPGSEGVVDLGDISQMTVEAEVYQSLIGRVVIGDPVTVTAPALGAPLTGQVSAIGLEIGRQSITSDDPAANTDARVVDVIVTLDPAASRIAQRLSNLQVVARIDAGRLQQ